MNETAAIIILLISALTGGLAALFLKINHTNKIKLLLSFSGAFLLGICVLHLLPEVFSNKNTNFFAGIAVLFGFLVQLFLEFLSRGIEHGHIHTNNKGNFPVTVILALCIHAIIEGMALSSGSHEHYSKTHLLLGIAIHKIPISLVLVVLLLKQQLKTPLILTTLVIFSICAPLGVYLGETSLSAKIIENEQIILGVALGIMLHISTVILFESTEHHKFQFKKFVTILVGFIAAIGITFL
jgi:zinc transporter ZupT